MYAVTTLTKELCLADCPHCGSVIDLVSAGDLGAYGINANALQHAREQGMFPAPWLSFGNRNIWLRDEVERYAEQRARKKIARNVNSLVRSLSTLPQNERTAALKMLEEELGNTPQAT
jgi:hypothetical protein